MLDKYSNVMAIILKGELFAAAMDEEGSLWSGRPISEKMLYDLHWALSVSRSSQRDCMSKGMLSVFDCLMCPHTAAS